MSSAMLSRKNRMLLLLAVAFVGSALANPRSLPAAEPDDPQDRGLVMTDQRHPTEAGALLIAEMLHDLGYDLAS